MNSVSSGTCCALGSAVPFNQLFLSPSAPSITNDRIITDYESSNRTSGLEMLPPSDCLERLTFTQILCILTEHILNEIIMLLVKQQLH